MPAAKRRKQSLRDAAKNPATKAVNVQLPGDLYAKLAATAELTRLTRANVFRLALERGLPVLAAQFNTESKA